MARKEAEFMEANEIVYETAALSSPEPKTGHDRKFDELLDSFGSQPNVKLSIYRQRAGLNDGLNLLETMPVDKYDYEGLHAYIKEAYGEGDYRIQIRKGGKLQANELITIELPRNQNVVKSDGGNGVVMAMLSELKDMRHELMTLKQGPQIDPMSQMMQMVQMMALMKDFMTPQQQTPMREVVETMTLLKELNGGTSNDADEKDSFMGFLGTVAEPLSQIIQSTATNAAQKNTYSQQEFVQGRKSVPDTQKSSTTQAYNNEVKKNQMINPQMMMLKAAIGPLINAAKKEGDVALYCDVVLDQIPESMLAPFFSMLQKENWFEELASLHKGVQPYKEWFIALRAEILLALEDDPDSDNADSENADANDLHDDQDPQRGSGDD